MADPSLELEPKLTGPAGMLLAPPTVMAPDQTAPNLLLLAARATIMAATLPLASERAIICEALKGPSALVSAVVLVGICVR